MPEQADVIVMGMGPGGEDIAGKLARSGLDVVGIEKELVGGVCPYWGCVPSKMMIRASNLLAEARRVDGMAGTATVHPDWAPVARRIREEATDSWDDRAAVERFEGKGGRLVRGFAKLIGPKTVAVDDREIEASRGIVVATGTQPFIPPIEGLGETPYWTNRDAVELEDLPDSLVVLGGGPVGLELAQVFARFGTSVTVVEALDRLLSNDEPEAGELISKTFADDGIDVVLGEEVERVSHDGGRFSLRLEGDRHIEGSRLLVATGRRARLSEIGAAKAGIDEDARWLEVDGKMRAGEGLWAVGDVTGKGPFTHVALYQARIAARDIQGRPVEEASYHALPRVTFTDPEVGSVGLTEQQAREDGIDVRTGTAQVPKSARGWIHKAGNEGFIKLVADAASGTLVGATSAGPAGGEVLSMLTLAVHAGVGIAQLRSMLYAYPTFHRAIEDALRTLDL